MQCKLAIKNGECGYFMAKLKGEDELFKSKLECQFNMEASWNYSARYRNALTEMWQLCQSCLHQRQSAPIMHLRRQYYLTGGSIAIILPQSCLTGGSLPYSCLTVGSTAPIMP
jgi:hypothetical protein